MPTRESPVRSIDLLPHVDSFHFGISNKAVADGAVSYNIDHLVKTSLVHAEKGLATLWLYSDLQSLSLSRALRFLNSRNSEFPCVVYESLQQTVLAFLATSLLTGETSPTHAGTTSIRVVVFPRITSNF